MGEIRNREHVNFEPFSLLSLLCSHWNIEGHKSAIVGNKLEDPEFLNIISKSDIVALTELHADEEVGIPGYNCLKFKKREKNWRGYKVGGGIGVYAKNEIAHLVQAIPNKNEDSIWIRLPKNFFGEKEDIYIGTYYISPSNCKNRKEIDAFTTINEEINFFNKKGIALVQGDINARTGIEQDFIENDKYDQNIGIENVFNQYIRNSEDQEIKTRGKDLLDICKMNDYLIMNGRTIGDLFGKFTSHQWNGSSVVDYFIVPNYFAKHVINFTVGEYLPWLSDHCPTHATILLKNHRKQGSTENLTSLSPSITWDDNAKNKYNEGLKATSIENRIKNLINDNNIKPLKLATEIKGILISNAEKCNLKRRNPQKLKKNYPNAAWFDHECNLEKQNLLEIGRKLKENPQDLCIRTELFDQKRKFKKLVKAKKYRYKCSALTKMTNMKKEKNQKEFWKMLKKISPVKTDLVKPSPTKFAKHFLSILTTNRPIVDVPIDLNKGALDYEINLEEIKGASVILKPGKATGIDYISNEMISSLLTNYPHLILKLFKSIMHQGEIIPEWVLGAIVPIHKKGPKNDPSNFRGITLMSCLGKLFLTILNNRLTQFAKENKILSEKQLGFVGGNRTSDAHIIINNLIQKYCHKDGLKIFSCFVDFSKAFDTIPRDILLTKLFNYGIRGQFFNIIRDIYKNDKSCVKIGNQCTETFNINQGVRQGCVLSPLLFNIFIADLVEKLDLLNGKVKMNNTEISSILWADDIVLLSENENGLREMLKVLEEYSSENKLEINNDKTKIMIFNKTGRLMNRLYYIKGNLLECVRSYKYLGFLLTPSGEINSGLRDLRDRALRAFMGIKNSLGTLFNQDIETTLTLVDAMIKPILLYNSDFWGCFKMPKNNPIENLYNSILKQLIGVHKSTTNVGVLLEVGVVPITIYARKLAIKNWERIRKNKANFMVIESYKESLKEKLPWIIYIKNLLEENGMLNFFINPYQDKPCFVNKRIFQTLSDVYHQNAFACIRQEGSKLRTYAVFKTEIGFEKYLTHIRNKKIRIQISQFRLSNHKLMIETGRHKKLQKEWRICPLCNNGIEDEIHFLFTCQIYQPLREVYVTDLLFENPYFQFYDVWKKLKYLMVNIDRNTGKYIYNCFELRNLLLNKPKRNV